MYRRRVPDYLPPREILLGIPGHGSLLVAAPGQAVLVRAFEKGLRNELWMESWNFAHFPHLETIHSPVWGWDIWRLLAFTSALSWQGSQYEVNLGYIMEVESNRLKLMKAVAAELKTAQFCAVCGKPFEHDGKRKYCSNACRQRAYRLRG